MLNVDCWHFLRTSYTPLTFSTSTAKLREPYPHTAAAQGSTFALTEPGLPLAGASFGVPWLHLTSENPTPFLVIGPAQDAKSDSGESP